jgi:hypothetical protein
MSRSRHAVLLRPAVLLTVLVCICEALSFQAVSANPLEPGPASSSTPSPTEMPQDVQPVVGANPCDWRFIGAACSVPGTIIHHAADSVVGGAVQSVTQWVADGAVGLLQQITDKLVNSATPDLNSAWFGKHYSTMWSLAALLILPILLAAIIQGLIRGDPIEMLRAAFVRVPTAIFFTAIAIAVAVAALTVTDGLTSAVSAGMGSDLSSFLGKVGSTVGAGVGVATGSPVAPLFVVFLGALVLAVGAFLIFLELIVREAALYICVLFLPLVLATSVWAPARVWTKRLVELLAAVVLSKFVIVAILAVGAGAMAAGSNGTGLAAILIGAAVVLLAALSPFKLLALIPMMEASIASGAHGSGTAAGQHVIGAAGSWARRVALSGDTGSVPLRLAGARAAAGASGGAALDAGAAVHRAATEHIDAPLAAGGSTGSTPPKPPPLPPPSSPTDTTPKGTADG